MDQGGKITNTSNIELIMQFFLHEFCPVFQSLLYERRAEGFSNEEQRVFLEFIMRIRYRAATLGDVWWYMWLQREKTTQARIKKVAQLFEKWCAVGGHGEPSEATRKTIADQMTEAIVRLGKTYRSHIHLIRHDLDLKQLEADIKYFEALRSLGFTALREVVSSAFGEIFNFIKREPSVVDRTDEPEEEETPVLQRRGPLKGRRRTRSRGPS